MGSDNMSDGSKKSKKGLGRGLDDLLAQHDTDLPFLSAYGEASGEHEEGVPLSAGADNAAELLNAIERLLIAALGADAVVSGEGVVKAGDWLDARIDETGKVAIEVSGKNLPLVPSDLAVPGLVSGELSEDRSSASVKIIQWGLETRRLLNRLCEHRSLTL